jgi:hypothetical protein
MMVLADLHIIVTSSNIGPTIMPKYTAYHYTSKHLVAMEWSHACHACC